MRRLAQTQTKHRPGPSGPEIATCVDSNTLLHRRNTFKVAYIQTGVFCRLGYTDIAVSHIWRPLFQVKGCVTRRKQRRLGIASNDNTTHLTTARSSADLTKGCGSELIVV